MLELHLKSRVGRRLFARFLLAALLPITGLAVYAYLKLGENLVESAHHRLVSDAKSYGMSLVEELNRSADALQMLIDASETVPEASPDFASIRAGLPPGESAPAPGQFRLRLIEDRPPELIAGLAVEPRALVAQLEALPFWNIDAAPEHFCVFGAGSEVLYCSPGLAGVRGDLIPPAYRDQNTAAGETEIAGAAYLLGFWRARYLPTLDSPGFVVMVATPKSLELAELAAYRSAFSAAVLLSIALAAGLAFSQLRRQLAPLVRLQASTQRLSAGELDARSDIQGEDEFGQLGRAFDQMAGRLQQKFQVLELLSKLDRAVLDSSDRQVVVQAMLEEIQLAVPCDCAGVLAFDEDGNRQLWLSERAADGSSGLKCIHVPAYEWAPVERLRSWQGFDTAMLPVTDLQARCEQPIVRVLAFPAYLGRRLDSVLLLAYSVLPESLDEIVQTCRSLADRLSISASSLARERMLYQQAHHDALTQLPNRLLLRDRIQQSLVQADRTQTAVALMFVDLDRFKQVNDSLGHAEGDALLVEYARRLLRDRRQGDTVARLGGDEFVVLVPDLPRAAAYARMDRMVRDLSATLAAPLVLGGQTIVSTASIGIALYPDNAGTAEELLKRADAAMYESKRRGSGAYCFYTSNFSALTRERFELTQELREAIGRGEFLLYYQPKVDARSGELVGAEALLRWNSPKRGQVLPGHFVGLLEEMGLSTWLGEWVLAQACAQMRAWDQAGFQAFPVSINFSPLQFERTPVLQRVRAALAQHQLEPGRLELEILESMAASESPAIRQALVELRRFGVSIALDDFGTGFSSLVNLTGLPADVLKLDRVFVQSVCAEPRQREVVELIVSLARVMQLKVVAEGVETEAQRALLPELGCDVLQGYLIGYPVAPEEFGERWLAPS